MTVTGWVGGTSESWKGSSVVLGYLLQPQEVGGVVC